MLDSILSDRYWIVETLADENITNNPYAVVNPNVTSDTIMDEVLTNYQNDKAFKTLVDAMEIYSNSGDYLSGLTDDVISVFESWFGDMDSVDDVVSSTEELKYESILNEVLITDYTSSWGDTLFDQNMNLENLKQKAEIFNKLSSYQTALKDLYGLSFADSSSIMIYNPGDATFNSYQIDIEEYVGHFLDAYSQDLETYLNSVIEIPSLEGNDHLRKKLWLLVLWPWFHCMKKQLHRKHLKACVATWKSIDAMVQVMGMTEVGRFEKGDRLLCAFPLWINYSLLNMMHEPLSLGVTLVLDPLFKPGNVVKRDNRFRLNHILSTPPYVKRITELDKKTDFSQLKIFITGGDTLPNDVKIKADKYIKKNGGTAQIVQGYGATECLGSFSYCYYPDSTLGSVGKPCIGNLIKIIDQDTGEELGVGETGVGYFYSPALMKEYYGDEAATQKNLVSDENGVLWYNTEDLLHVNEKGEIFLDGRIRRIVLTYDENGNPTKIIPDKLNKKCFD